MLISVQDLQKIKTELFPALLEVLKHNYPGCSLYLFDNFQGGTGNIIKSIEINIANIGKNKNSNALNLNSSQDKALQVKVNIC